MFRRLTATCTAALLGLAVLLGMAPRALAAAPAQQARAAAQDTAGRIRVFAHRGASAYAPENTLAAVRAAAELGAVWVENDVQRTRDGRLVVIHDTTLSRTTDVEERYPGRMPWNVSDFTLKEIRTLDAGSWFDSSFAGERVPTLERYLRLLGDTGQRLLLEIKSPELYPGIEEQTLQVLRDHGWLGPAVVRDRLLVQSFSADCVATVHTLHPEVRTAFLGTPAEDELQDYARFTDNIHPPHRRITPAYVTAVHAVRGPHGTPLGVATWTVNDVKRARQVAAAGVDGIITNTPDTVAAAVDGRLSSARLRPRAG